MSADKLMMFTLYTVILTMGLSMLSVEAILCHQCNSHSDPGCFDLKSSKILKNSDIYLKECDGFYDGKEPFCRKTMYTIEFAEESRVIRSCGWIDEVPMNLDGNKIDQCINADNEGYKQMLCNCYVDGCNGAPSISSSVSMIGVMIIWLLFRSS